MLHICNATHIVYQVSTFVSILRPSCFVQVYCEVPLSGKYGYPLVSGLRGKIKLYLIDLVYCVPCLNV